MGNKLNEETYSALIKEDLEWLDKQGDDSSMAKQHIRMVLNDSIKCYYPEIQPNKQRTMELKSAELQKEIDRRTKYNCPLHEQLNNGREIKIFRQGFEFADTFIKADLQQIVEVIERKIKDNLLLEENARLFLEAYSMSKYIRDSRENDIEHAKELIETMNKPLNDLLSQIKPKEE